MNKIMKRTIAVVLVMVLLFGAAPAMGIAGIGDWLTVRASAKTISEYAVGDHFEFGWYPQSKVTDSVTLTALNIVPKTWWQSYGYYSGKGGVGNGLMTASDYMQYCDVVLGGQKYRGVKFTQYRPECTGYSASADYSYIDDNGYAADTVYWFLYEPLYWRVLDPATGLLLCETIIDNQPYNNYILSSGKDEYGYGAYYGDADKTHYANNYAESSLRQWLNDDFYNTAFSPAQQDIITYTTLDNSAYSTSYSAYDSVSTTDKVFLLSYKEAQNAAYGFSTEVNANDAARKAEGTDYAKCQGLYVRSSNKCSSWWLRSAGFNSGTASNVYSYGSIQIENFYRTNYNIVGIRPALKLNLTSTIFQSDVSDLYPSHELSITTVEPTCTEDGSKVVTCSHCDYRREEILPALGHDWKTTTVKATCTNAGYKTMTCARCGESNTENYERLPHNYKAVVTSPTATKGGYTTYTCSMCGRKVTAHETPPTGSPVYTLTFNANGGTVQSQATFSKTYSKGNSISKPTPVRSGYSFIEWYPTLPQKMPDHDLTAYAVWKPTHAHETTILNQKEPTCEVAGLTGMVYCATCNEILDNGTTIPATGHAWDNGATTMDATCTDPGVKTYTCKVCSGTREETIPAWGHCYDNGFVFLAPTCVDEGKKEFTCVACGLTYTDSVPANGHTYDKGKITTAPTCTDEGIKTFTCTVCGHTYTKSVPANGHNYAFAVETLPTCTVDGVMRYTCTVCSDSYTAPIKASHKYNAVRTEPTCTENGAITYTCTVCGDSYADPIEKLGHTYKTVVTAPTCTVKGYTTYTCSRCGDAYQSDETDMIPHSYKDVVTAPTCTQKGYTTHTCTVCGDSYTSDETDIIPHSYKDVVTAPTCTEKGYTTHTCTVCGDSYTSDETEIVPHTYGDWEWETEPTIDTDGLLVKVCSVCGHRNERPVEKTYLRFEVLKDEETGQEYAVVTGLQDEYPDKIIVPAELAGVPVTRIAEYAFLFANDDDEEEPTGYSFTEAEILAPIEELEEAVFGYCKKLRSVTLPDSLKSIGDHAFHGCYELQRISLPEQVESIGDTAFAFCVNLQQVTLPEGLKAIGSAAFGRCKSMQQIALPEGIEYLGEAVFAQSGLLELTIPATLSEVEGTAFVGCPKMTAYHVEAGNTSFMAVDGVLFDKEGKTLIAFPMGRGDTEYSVPDGVEMIGTAAFDYVVGDEDVHDSGFVPATLQTVRLPSSLKTIGDVAFYGVTQMQSIDIPDGVTEIGEIAFAQCIGLKRVTIPAGIQTIGEFAFDECDSLQAVCYAGTSTSWNRISIGSYNDALKNAKRYYHRHDQASASLTGRIDPTCTAEGYTGSYTFECGFVLGGGEVIPALGHTYRTEITAPTCEVNGYTTYICTRCGSSYMDNVVDAIGHEYIVTKHKDATCTESGYDIYGCKHDSSHTYTQTIPVKGHDYKITVVAPTCTAKGYTTHTCTRCSDSYVTDEKAAIGHAWDSGKVTKAATCTEDGVRTFTCTHDSSHTRTESIAATGHSFGAWTQTKAPTVYAEGVETQYCTKCTATNTRSIPKLPMPKVNIQNFTASSKAYDYRSTITFKADVDNKLSGGQIHWFVDGKEVGTGDSYTAENVKQGFSLQAKYYADGKEIPEAATEVEKVNVNTGFGARLKAFFRSLFGLLPKVTQEYLGIEFIDRVIPD